MKKFYYVGLAGLVLFEVLRVYFIMPFPGSQRMNSLELAYFLHTARWWLRVGFLLLIATGIGPSLTSGRRWLPVTLLVLVGAVVGFFNFKMTADHMFRQPAKLLLNPRAENVVDENSLVVAIEHGGEARAYPIRYLVYHHQVQDTIGGAPVIVTYCSVCRTGRVFAPLVDGRPEKFRLVGMDHFNAMFEDAGTGSWWRQATGEAVAGPLKGRTLPEVASSQLTLGRWFDLHPTGRVMQPDAASGDHYDSKGLFEQGRSAGSLTRTDPASWQEKSWVVGVQLGRVTKAYDWNVLKARRVINDQLGDTPLVLALAPDDKSFAAFVRPGGAFTLQGDTLSADGRTYDFSGRERSGAGPALRAVPAYQEFWHSWRTFHPDTGKSP